MNSEIIDRSEMLYRVIKRSFPDAIGRNGNVSPALFKVGAGEGVSVDRDGERTEAEIIQFITEVTFANRTKGIVRLEASFCYDIGTELKPSPSSNNSFHANIYLSNEERERNIQALKMADRCTKIYMNEKMRWVV